MLLELQEPTLWPAELRSYLDKHYEVFLGWETGVGRVAPATYDKAIYGLMDVLAPYAVTGWHCTRLTDAEIDEILRNGMHLPDVNTLTRRVDALLESGEITADIARRLKDTNQAGDAYRAGMVWFCFFRPGHAGESGIVRFFRHWGGEALYNSHEDDAITSPVLRRIGTPSIVEADVPIASFEPNGGLASKVVRRFLITRGLRTVEPTDHEDRIKRSLSAENVRRVIRYPDPDFVALTGCDRWRTSLQA